MVRMNTLVGLLVLLAACENPSEAAMGSCFKYESTWECFYSAPLCAEGRAKFETATSENPVSISSCSEQATWCYRASGPAGKTTRTADGCLPTKKLCREELQETSKNIKEEPSVAIIENCKRRRPASKRCVIDDSGTACPWPLL